MTIRSKPSAESDLATKYLVQLDNLTYYQKKLARIQNLNRVELAKLQDIETQLQGCVSKKRPRMLVRGGYRRYVLVKLAMYSGVPSVEVLDLVPDASSLDP